MLQMTGERQLATDLSGIKPDHLKRYEFAAQMITERLGFEIDTPTVLDAACGVGYGTYVMAQAGHSVTGVDISQDALDIAIENYSVENMTQFKQCDAVRDALPPKPYDVIVSFETIEHVKEDDILLSKFSEVAPYMIVSVPNENIVPFSKETHPFHFKHYTPEGFEALLEKTGWLAFEWYTQYDKWDGEVYEADDGRSLIALCRSKKIS